MGQVAFVGHDAPWRHDAQSGADTDKNRNQSSMADTAACFELTGSSALESFPAAGCALPATRWRDKHLCGKPRASLSMGGSTHGSHMPIVSTVRISRGVFLISRETRFRSCFWWRESVGACGGGGGGCNGGGGGGGWACGCSGAGGCCGQGGAGKSSRCGVGKRFARAANFS